MRTFEQHNDLTRPVQTAGDWVKGTLQEMRTSLKNILVHDPKSHLQRSKGLIGKSADVSGGMVASVVREGIRLPLAVITGITMSTTASIAKLLGGAVMIGGRAAARNLLVIAMPTPTTPERRH